MQFKCALADDRKSRLEFEASLHSNGTGVYEREGSPRLPLHLSCVTRLTHGIACFKQVQLNLRGQIVSVHDYYRVDATQHMLLLLSQGGVRLAVALRLRPWNSTRAFPSGKGSAGALFWTSWRFISHARNMAQLFFRPACFGMGTKDVRQ